MFGTTHKHRSSAPRAVKLGPRVCKLTTCYAPTSYSCSIAEERLKTKMLKLVSLVCKFSLYGVRWAMVRCGVPVHVRHNHRGSHLRRM